VILTINFIAAVLVLIGTFVSDILYVSWTRGFDCEP